MRAKLLPAVLASAAVTAAGAASGCHGHHTARVAPRAPVAAEGTGPHAEAIARVLHPFLASEVVSGLVVGVYDQGRSEIYGFGAGPNGKRPTSRTLFEIGPVTKVFTSLLLADAVQRREVDLETPVAELLPPGVTVPVQDGKAITLKLLALHSSGLPPLPPSLIARADKPDPYRGYTEDAFYDDLNATALQTAPGTRITYSAYGSALLGDALGHKLSVTGGGYPAVLSARVLSPLGLADTYIDVPPILAGRVAQGTDDDGKPIARTSWGALAPAGGLVSDAHDLLALAVDELDASEGGSRGLAHAMKLTQEPQLQGDASQNEGLGWFIDSSGRYWHSGGSGGFHAFVGFDPKARRAVVILSATQFSPIDHVADMIYDALAGKESEPIIVPHASQMQRFVGSYDFQGTQIDVTLEGRRLYLAGPGEPRHRLVPLSANEFWVEELQGVAAFQRDEHGKLVLVFAVGANRLAAPRIGESPPEERPPPVPVSPAR